jgi:hypothetical protein
MLTAAVALSLSMSVTSCKSDDDNSGNDSNGGMTIEDVDPTDNEEARTAFRWLCILTDAEGFDQNWQSKTWEPTVGDVSEDNDNTRIIVVDSLEEARENFSKLADMEASKIGEKQTVDGGAAGTLTWEQSAQGAPNFAVVNVNSRIMPHLQKIVYCTEEQRGSNGSNSAAMKGTPYYRFGDVICDGQGYYWVCVRPAYAPRNKECKPMSDSHWINIFNAAKSGGGVQMPAANVKTKWNNLKKYNNQTIKLPTALKYNWDQIYNLSNLTWALIDPALYKKYVDRDGTLAGLPYEFVSSKFFELVSFYWEKTRVGDYTIWEVLFNHPVAEMRKLKKMIFYYQGYSWISGETGHVWGFTSTSYKTFAETDKEKINFVKDGFDVNYYAQADVSRKYVNRFAMDGGDTYIGRWVVRYAQGKDLMTGGKYSPYTRITSKDGKTKDIYRFNQKLAIVASPKITESIYSFIADDK